ncbi:hypothetical protein NN561_003845 [Cricetulus griseus]
MSQRVRTMDTSETKPECKNLQVKMKRVPCSLTLPDLHSSSDQCDPKPELILKLEQEAGPWKAEDALNQSLPDMQHVNDPNEISQDNRQIHGCNLVIAKSSTSAEERAKAGKTLTSSNCVLRLAVKSNMSSVFQYHDAHQAHS